MPAFAWILLGLFAILPDGDKTETKTPPPEKTIKPKKNDKEGDDE